MVFNKPYSSSMEKEIQKAANIINSFFNNSTVDADSAIPAEMIKNCVGLAFLTVVKAGLVWTGKLGTGVVIARLDDGTWSAPSGIGTAGIGFGAEIGGEIIDFMIVLGSKGAVNTFKKGTQVSVGAGLELAVGPLGRAAGGNLNAGGGGLSANYTYSRAKGAFAGVGLHGSTILVRGEMNSKFYGREVTPMEILSGHVQAPPGACDRLLEAIAMAEGRQGITVYPSSDPRSSHYSGNAGSFNNGSGAYAPSQSSDSQRHSSFGSRSSFNNGSASSRSSFNNGSASSSSAAATTSRASMPAQPSGPDPRVTRYSSYKSEAELYEQYARNKSNSSAAAPSPQNNGGAGYAAAPAAQGYGGGAYAAAPAAQGYGGGSAYAAAPAAQGYGGGSAYGAAPAAQGYGGGSAYAAAPAAPSGYGAPAAAAVPAAAAAYGASSNAGYGYNAAPAPAPAPAATPSYGGGGYGYNAPPVAAPAAPPAPPAPAPTRLSFKTVPVTTYKPDYGTQTSSRSSMSSVPAPPLPPPAVGPETKQVYTDVIAFVSSKCPYANVQIFKDNCRLFGQDQMSLDAYMAYLTSICTTPLLKELVPQLVRLLPTHDKRENLWALYVREVLMIRS